MTSTPSQENIKLILDHLMDTHGDRIRLLSSRPVIKSCFKGIVQRWEQNHAPAPITDVKPVEEDTKFVLAASPSDVFQC